MLYINSINLLCSPINILCDWVVEFPRAECAFCNWCSLSDIINQMSLWAENLKCPLTCFFDLLDGKTTWKSETAWLFQDFHENFTPFSSCSTHPPTPKLNPPLQVVFTRMEKKNVYFKIIFCKFMGVSNYDSEAENRKSCWRQLNSIVVCAWAVKWDSLTTHLTSTHH